MLVLPGSAALSDARFQLLAESVAALDQSLRLREINYAYAVDAATRAPLDEDRLAALLQPGTATPADTEALQRPGHRIVTVLCDGGDRYRSRIWSREWLQSRGLRQPERLSVGSVL